MGKHFLLSLITVGLCLAVPLSERSVLEDKTQQRDTRLSPLVPVKNVTGSVGHNVTAHCEVPADFSIEAVVVTKGVDTVLLHRDQRVEVSEHVWLTGCNNLTDCHNLVVTILVANNSSFGTYEVSIKSKPDGKTKTISICKINVTSPPASGGLTVTPTKTKTPTSANLTAAMSNPAIAGITTSVIVVLCLVVGGVVYCLVINRREQPGQRGDYPAGQHERLELNGVHHHEDNGNTSDEEGP